MKGLFLGDDNSLGDANKDKYYRYIGLVSEIRAGKSKSFLIADERGKNIEVESSFYAISSQVENRSYFFIRQSRISCQ
jgi:hypothetical protein